VVGETDEDWEELPDGEEGLAVREVGGGEGEEGRNVVA